MLGLSLLILDGRLGDVVFALTRPLAEGRTDPLDAVIVSMVALLTVADIIGRKWIAPLAFVVIGSTAVTAFLSGASTALAVFQLVAPRLGRRPRLPVRIRRDLDPASGPGDRRCAHRSRRATGASRGGGLGRRRGPSLPRHDELVDGGRPGHGPRHLRARLWRLLRLLRLRQGSTRPVLTLRAELEQDLMGLTLAQARIPAPRPVAAREVGPFSAVIAFLNQAGTPVSELAADLDDAQLAQIWRMHATLLRLSVAHGGSVQTS